MCELHKGETGVSALQQALGLSQSSLSQHLARLREDELVTTRRESQAIFYSLANSNVSRMISFALRIVLRRGMRRKAEAEEGGTKGKREGELFARPHKIERTRRMTIDRIVMAFAGAMILASLGLAHLFGPWWLLLAAFVGLNLFQAAFTGFCPLALILKKFGVKPGAAF